MQSARRTLWWLVYTVAAVQWGPEARVRVYLTGSSKSIDELNHHADSLRWAGHDVEVGQPAEGVDNVGAVRRSDVVVLLDGLDEPEATGAGQSVELGLALAWGKHIFVIGPGKTPSHLHGEIQRFPNWGAKVFEALEDLW